VGEMHASERTRTVREDMSHNNQAGYSHIFHSDSDLRTMGHRITKFSSRPDMKTLVFSTCNSADNQCR